MKTIKNPLLKSVKSLYQKQRRVAQKLKDIREKCAHPFANVIKEYNSNTGNIDPGDDSFWISMHCLKCDLRLSFSSSSSEYDTIDSWNCMVRKNEKICESDKYDAEEIKIV